MRRALGWQQGHAPLCPPAAPTPQAAPATGQGWTLGSQTAPEKSPSACQGAGASNSSLHRAGVCAANISGWFRAGQRHVSPGRDWEGSASGKSRRKDGCQGNAIGKHHIKSHKFPNHFSEQLPLILVPWDQTQNKQAECIKHFCPWVALYEGSSSVQVSSCAGTSKSSLAWQGLFHTTPTLPLWVGFGGKPEFGQLPAQARC